MVSVIIPVYNCIQTLERCVQSIKSQTFTDWELLLIDDGSTDGSGQICDRFENEDLRIRVFHKSNGGVSSARNMGLDNARGEYVMFCDSDDWVNPEWCEQLYLATKKYPGCQPICNYYRSVLNQEIINQENQCRNLEECIAKADFFSLNKYELLGIPWNKIYCRRILEEHKIRFCSEISLGEDLIFNLDFIHYQTGGYAFINKPLYHYKIGMTDSLSSKYYPNLSEIYRKIYSRIECELHSISGAYKKWEIEYFRSFFFAFDRVFRNTWSKENGDSLLKKWRYNFRQFHSKEFQDCRKIIKKSDINILQFFGLKTNCFLIYWICIILSETISSLRITNE